MIQPAQVVFKVEKETSNFGVFVVSPLPKGFGHTLGSALRRVLIASLPGAALSQVKFATINHPFATIKGVKEDGVELALNLKKVVLRMHTDNPVVLELSKKGPGEVTAGDIKVPPEIEVVNKDLVIAHLADKNTILEAELVAEKGVGYVLAEDKKVSRLGAIPLDCAFSPIVNVSYRVEQTRYLTESNLDHLVLEVKANGAISPKEAMVEAAKILTSFFSRLSTGEEKIEEVKAEEQKPSLVMQETIARAREILVDDIALPVRVVNALRKVGVVSVADILERGRGGLAKVRNLGEKSIAEVDKVLKKEGFELV